MKTFAEFACILDNIRLPFGWKASVTAETAYAPDSFDPRAALFRRTQYVLRVGDADGKCNVTGDPMPWWGRKWLLSEHMTDGEVVQTVWLAFMTAAEHEFREQFLYKGQAVLDPHYDVDKLVQLRARPDALKERDMPTVAGSGFGHYYDTNPVMTLRANDPTIGPIQLTGHWRDLVAEGYEPGYLLDKGEVVVDYQIDDGFLAKVALP